MNCQAFSSSSVRVTGRRRLHHEHPSRDTGHQKRRRDISQSLPHLITQRNTRRPVLSATSQKRGHLILMRGHGKPLSSSSDDDRPLSVGQVRDLLNELTEGCRGRHRLELDAGQSRSDDRRVRRSRGGVRGVLRGVLEPTDVVGGVRGDARLRRDVGVDRIRESTDLIGCTHKQVALDAVT